MLRDEWRGHRVLPHVVSPAPEMTSASVRQRNANCGVNEETVKDTPAAKTDSATHVSRLVVFQITHRVLAIQARIVLLCDLFLPRQGFVLFVVFTEEPKRRRECMGQHGHQRIEVRSWTWLTCGMTSRSRTLLAPVVPISTNYLACTEPSLRPNEHKMSVVAGECQAQPPPQTRKRRHIRDHVSRLNLAPRHSRLETPTRRHRSAYRAADGLTELSGTAHWARPLNIESKTCLGSAMGDLRAKALSGSCQGRRIENLRSPRLNVFRRLHWHSLTTRRLTPNVSTVLGLSHASIRSASSALRLEADSQRASSLTSPTSTCENFLGRKLDEVGRHRTTRTTTHH